MRAFATRAALWDWLATLVDDPAAWASLGALRFSPAFLIYNRLNAAKRRDTRAKRLAAFWHNCSVANGRSDGRQTCRIGAS
jgi:hypothetical protein